MYFFHLLILGLSDDINLPLGSFHVNFVSSLQLSDLVLQSLVLLVRGDDPVGELLTDDVRDVVALFVPFVQKLNPTKNNMDFKAL